MPITLLDILLLGVMLISGLLAMIRGFMREMLSIAAWGVAALATLLFLSQGCCRSRKATSPTTSVATGVVIGGVFLLTLLIVSIITVRISDMILDSRVGALDRTLGFLFGLGRGLIIVVVAFLFFAWLVPERSQPDWVSNAKSQSRAEKYGTMADVHVAGRPRKHHLEAVEEARSRTTRTRRRMPRPASAPTGVRGRRPARDAAPADPAPTDRHASADR